MNTATDSSTICLISVVCVGIIAYGIFGILHRKIFVLGKYSGPRKYEGREAVNNGWAFVIIGLVVLILSLIYSK